jgi:biotin carboxylase
MPRLLLLIATQSYRAEAFVEAALGLGCELTVGTDRRQSLSHLNPAGNLTLDFADVEAGVRGIESFARLHPLAAIVAADDDGVLLAARAAAVLGLRHNAPAAVACARDKALTRAAFEAGGLPVPWHLRLGPDDDPGRRAAQLRYPCVVKPLDLSASRGVIRADDPAGFVAAFRRCGALLRALAPEARPGDPRLDLLVEVYVEGAEVALEGLLVGGRLRALALFDKPDPLEGPFFEETLYVTPSRLPHPTQGAVEEAVAAGAAALGLTEGPVHAEVRLAAAGPVVLEIAPRSIGGLCSRALRFGRGVSLESLLLRHALGEDVAGLVREPRASGVMMIPIPRAGTLRGVSGVAEALQVGGVEDIRITLRPGDELVPLPEGHRYLGFIFARGDAPAGVEQALRDAHRRLTFEIAPAARAGQGVA